MILFRKFLPVLQIKQVIKMLILLWYVSLFTASSALLPFWLQKACGRVDSPGFTPHVVCGSSVTAKQVPWQVSIVHDGLGTHWCGGTLVSPLHVLTAAHCFSSVSCSSVGCNFSSFTLHFGRTNRTDIPNRNGASVFLQDAVSVHRKISRLVLHENWSGDFGNDFIADGKDIALIFLSEEIELSNEILPACLPVKADEYLFTSNALVSTSGFGLNSSFGPEELRFPHTLQVAEMIVLDSKDCVSRLNMKLAEDYICTKTSNSALRCNGYSQDTCNGDSGGPLVARKPGSGQWILGGITSFGTRHCGFEGLGFPSFFTNVLFHREWIDKALNSLMVEIPFSSSSSSSLDLPKEIPEDKQDNKLILVGGDENGVQVTKIGFSDKGNKVCRTNLESLPFKRASASVVGYNGSVFVCGGTSGSFEHPIIHAECFELNSKESRVKWKSLANMPKKTVGGITSKAGSSMYVFEGTQEPLCSDYLEIQILNLKSKTWRFIKDSNPPRAFGSLACAATLQDRYIFISGGWKVPETDFPCSENTPPPDIIQKINREPSYYLNELQIYDSLRNEWYSGPFMTQRRRNHGCAFVKTKKNEFGFLVVGGYNHENLFLSDVEFLSLSTWNFEPETLWSLQWIPWSPLNSKRGSKPSVFQVKNQIYVLGGNFEPEIFGEIYSVENESWSNLSNTESEYQSSFQYASQGSFFDNTLCE